MILGIVGRAGSGKDTVGEMLQALPTGRWSRMSFAAPLKDICKQVYDFSDEQLYGPSEKRNEPDKRYPREHGPITGLGVESTCLCCGEYLDTTPDGRYVLEVFRDGVRVDGCFLTPRYALQTLGTQWGRAMYPNTWVELGIRQALALIGNRRAFGSTGEGDEAHVVFTDCRFVNEAKAIKAAGGKVWRVWRTSADVVPATHDSEREMDTEAMRELIDFHLFNDDSLEQLKVGVLEALAR